MVEQRRLSCLPENDSLREKFNEMLSSASFLKALKISAECTLETGLETGFKVSLLWNSQLLSEQQLWIEEVLVGEARGMENPKPLEEIDGSPELFPPDYVEPRAFFLFHFHPHDEDVIIPSPEDLAVFRAILNPFEFVGVGQINRSHKVRMIVMSRPKYKLDIDYYDRELDRVQDQNDVFFLLGAAGISSLRVKTEI